MAHYAEIDENNIVLRVMVVNNEDIIDPETGEESETTGVAFCKEQWGGNWVKTSYNHNIRKRYAGIRYSYNEELDAFVLPKPFESWVLNEETANWESPVGSAPKLTQDEIDSGSFYRWDENSYKENNANGWILETFTVN